MSALELAKRLKQEHLEEQEEARHAKQLKSESDARIRKKLEDILDKTLGEFDGVNEIEFKIQAGINACGRQGPVVSRYGIAVTVFDIILRMVQLK